MIKSVDKSVQFGEIRSLKLDLLILFFLLLLLHWLLFLLIIITESMKSVELLLRLCLKCCNCLFRRLLQNLNLLLQLLYRLVDLRSSLWWKHIKLVESVQSVNPVVQGIVIRVLWLYFLWLLGLLWLNFIGFALLAENNLTSALGFFFPSFFLGQDDIFSIFLSLFFSSFIVISVRSDILAVLDHEFAQVDGLPVWISVDESLSLGLELLFSFFITFFSFFILLDSFLSLFLSFFELLLLFGLSISLFLLSFFIFLFTFSLVVDLFLDILDVSQQVFLILPEIKIFIVLGSEFIHFLTNFISLSLSLLYLLIVLSLDVFDCSDFSDDAFFLFALLLKISDLIF